MRATRSAVLVGGLVAAATLAVGVGAAAADTAFVAGAATAEASSIAINVHQGNGNVGIAVGVSAASYRENYASADSKPLDLQLFKLLLGESSQCPGSTLPVPIPNGSMPAELQANSLMPNVGTTIEQDTMVPGWYGAAPTSVAGHGTARVTSTSQAAATTSNPTSDLFVLQLVNPSTSVAASLDGEVRSASATSTAERLVVLGGIMTIERPTWKATAASGRSTRAEGSFATTGGTLFGFPRTPAESVQDLANFGELLEGVLGFIGVGLDMPKVTVNDKTVHVSPLRLHLTDAPLGKDVIAPLLSAPLFGGLPSLETAINTAFDSFAAESCDNRRNRQFLDIAVQVLRGSGAIELPIGGVTVSTDDTPPPPPDPELEAPVDTTASTTPTAGGQTFASDAVVAGSFADRSDSSFSFDASGDAASGAWLGSHAAGALDDGSAPADPGDASPNVASGGGQAESETIQFATPIASATRTVPGSTGGVPLAISMGVIAVGALGFGAERLLAARKRAATT